jgi:hypothetical protein
MKEKEREIYWSRRLEEENKKGKEEMNREIDELKKQVKKKRKKN